MNIRTKRNIGGTIAIIGILSLFARIIQLAVGGDIDGWHITMQLLITTVFAALWLKYRRQYDDEEFYRRYRDTYNRPDNQ